MAATVLSGSSNVTYTNSTGGNARVIINYMASPTAMTWTTTAGGTATITATNVRAIGRNLAFSNGIVGSSALTANNMGIIDGTSAVEATSATLPTEIMLAGGQTFTATCSNYNIVVIPEAG